MNSSDKKIGQINGLVEVSYVGVITAIFRHLPRLIERGGDWSLILLPLSALVNAKLYWNKTQQADFKDGKLKTGLNGLYHATKVAAAAVGVGFAIAGALTVGFGVLIASGYLSVARNLYKAARSAWEGNVKKVGNNLGKAFVGGLISGGFTLLTFYPGMALVGATMVFMGTASVFLALAPHVIADLTVTPKLPPMREMKSDLPTRGVSSSPPLRPSISTEKVVNQEKTGRPRSLTH